MKLSLLALVALIGLLILGIQGIIQLKTVNHGLDTVYNDRVIPLEQLKIIADEYAVNIVDTTHQTRNGNFDFEKCILNINTAENKIKTQWDDLSKLYLLINSSLIRNNFFINESFSSISIFFISGIPKLAFME